jgi:hypothetical protein
MCPHPYLYIGGGLLQEQIAETWVNLGCPAGLGDSLRGRIILGANRPRTFVRGHIGREGIDNAFPSLIPWWNSKKGTLIYSYFTAFYWSVNTEHPNKVYISTTACTPIAGLFVYFCSPSLSIEGQIEGFPSLTKTFKRNRREVLFILSILMGG